MASNYGAYGGAASSVFNAFATTMQIQAQNKAIEAEAQFNIDMYKAKEELTKFAQTNNSIRATQIQNQLLQEQAAAVGKVQVQEIEAISKEVIRRGEGITAGRSVERSVEQVIQTGAEAKQETMKQYNDKISQVGDQARQANAQEQAGLINAYGDMTMKNAQLAGKVITGAQSAMMIAQSGIGGFIQGMNTGNSLEQALFGDKTVSNTSTGYTTKNSLTESVQGTSDLLGLNTTQSPISNLLIK